MASHIWRVPVRMPVRLVHSGLSTRANVTLLLYGDCAWSFEDSRAMMPEAVCRGKNGRLDVFVLNRKKIRALNRFSSDAPERVVVEMRVPMDSQQAACKWLPVVVMLFGIVELSCPRFSYGLGGRLANDGAFSPACTLLKRTTLQKPNHGSRSVSRKLAEHLNAVPWFTFSYNATLGLLDIFGEINEDYLAAGVEPEVKSDFSLEAKPEMALSRISASKSAGEVKDYKFEVCSSRLKEYVPCVDNTAASKKLQSDGRGERWERHCPTHKDRMCCLIAAPVNYKFPIRWPKSRDEVWYSNVPHKQLVADKGAQNWIKLEKDRFTFPGGGTQFAHGASQYLDHIGKMIPAIGYGRRTRVALDIGCGVASFGAYLLDRDVITLSIAPKDVHENQIQFALERGLPAMIAVLATRRLPYPSQAFDLIHCSRCRIDWTRNNGILLIEVNRLLKAGAYFVWSARPVYKHEEEQEKIWKEMENLTSRLCWEQVGKDGQIAVWRKPLNNSCYEIRSFDNGPTLCEENDDLDNVWYVPLKSCISLLPNRTTGIDAPEWPMRLSSPPRIQNIHMDAGLARQQVLKSDNRYWYVVVEGYLRGLGLRKEDFRNVMDMRAMYGGFAAALITQKVDWWVMNVVSISGPNTLPVIYDRGLIGVIHDWCEPFDTYPRTYDLLHASGLFSRERKRCNIAHIVLEMDRMLRPGGWVLVRESTAMALRVQALAKSVRWQTQILETESGEFGKDKLLSCQKLLWKN